MLTREETDVLHQISKLLDTGLDRAELELLVELVLDGAHPEVRPGGHVRCHSYIGFSAAKPERQKGRRG